jgi:hypothetical protein
MPVDLHKWFWLADDGRVFSSERGLIVDTSDAAYIEFISVQSAAPWPRDANGNQTELSLQAALAPLGIGISLLSYADQALFARRHNGFVYEGDLIDTRPDASEILIHARLAVMVDPLWTTPYVNTEGEIVTIGETEIMAVSSAMLNFWRDCLAAYATVKLGIIGGTITTKEQIDAAFLAVGD